MHLASSFRTGFAIRVISASPYARGVAVAYLCTEFSLKSSEIRGPREREETIVTSRTNEEREHSSIFTDTSATEQLSKSHGPRLWENSENAWFSLISV